MFYAALTSCIRFVVDTFFRRVEVVGDERVPRDGPVIFAGNHPNALMDGLLLVAKSPRRPIHFMGNAKLWDYPLLGRLLDALKAVPVYRRQDYPGDIDNSDAFERFHEVVDAGNCIGVFPEGISHAESELAPLKTGTARIALEAGARRNSQVTIVPCGLNYIQRHRFRSQVFLEFGEPITIDEPWLTAYEQQPQETVRALTADLQEALAQVALTAPDRKTLRFVHTARRLYKPKDTRMTPQEYVELSRRFIAAYQKAEDNPKMIGFRKQVENYQRRLDVLGIKDHQLRRPIHLGKAIAKLLWRVIQMLILLPFALPGAILHLPVGWVASTIGKRFSYDLDDIASLKVFAAVLLIPVVYAGLAAVVGIKFGLNAGLIFLVFLILSFYASIKLLEGESRLIFSAMSIMRRARLKNEILRLRDLRQQLSEQVRELASEFADPDLPRIFSADDFATADTPSGD